MSLDQAGLTRMLTSAAGLLEENADLLSEIDSRFGDGDHGITIRKIAACIRRTLAEWQDGDIKAYLDDLGMQVMGVNGGSAGPLYGTLLGGLAVALPDGTTEIDPPMLRQMLATALVEMEDITTAKVGDKTMMDALIPAVEAAQKAPDSIDAILQAAAEAARAGAKASEGFVSKFGRARSYKEQTIGTPDVGAMSTALFFEGLAQGIS